MNLRLTHRSRERGACQHRPTQPRNRKCSENRPGPDELPPRRRTPGPSTSMQNAAVCCELTRTTTKPPARRLSCLRPAPRVLEAHATPSLTFEAVTVDQEAAADVLRNASSVRRQASSWVPTIRAVVGQDRALHLRRRCQGADRTRTSRRRRSWDRKGCTEWIASGGRGSGHWCTSLAPGRQRGRGGEHGPWAQPLLYGAGDQPPG